MNTHRSSETLVITDKDGMSSSGNTSTTTLEDFAPLLDAENFHHHSTDLDNMTRENTELRRHIKRRTQALDTIRKAYILDVESLKKNLREQAETPAKFNLSEASLERVPSLDFRPVLQLYAPDDAYLQISPCDECGGTMEIIHHDSKGIMKLKTQIDFAHRELAETGEQLANSNALAKVYCLKADAMESEYSQLKSTMVKETLSLKKKVEGAGPEVVRKLSEEREKAESRLRLATRKASELESIADKMKAQLLQAAEDEAKIMEMEYHLEEGLKTNRIMAAQMDLQATVEDELRLVVTHMKEDAREAADTQASLRKVLQDQEETGRQATAKLRNLLEKSKNNEAILIDELAALREEYLANSLVDEHSEDSMTEQLLPKNPTGSGESPKSPASDFFTAYNGETDVVESPAKSEKMAVLELSEELKHKEQEWEKLRRQVTYQSECLHRGIDQSALQRELEDVKEKAGDVVSSVETTAALGESVLSGAYERWGEQAALGKTELLEILAKAEAQAHQMKKENSELLKLWNDARVRLHAAEEAIQRERGVDLTHLDDSNTYLTDRSTTEGALHGAVDHRSDEAGDLGTGGDGFIERDKARIEGIPTIAGREAVGPINTKGKAVIGAKGFDRKVASLSNRMELEEIEARHDSNGDERGDVEVQTVVLLEEEGRKLRKEKGKIQEHCTSLEHEIQQLQESFEKSQTSLEQEKRTKEEYELDLEERRGLLSKATLSIAEHSMALHDANDAKERVEDQLRAKEEEINKLQLKLKEMSSLNAILEGGLAAATGSLDILAVAKREAETVAQHNRLRAELASCRAEAEGMRAEEVLTQHYLFGLTTVKKIEGFRLELKRHQTELRRRRKEAKEHDQQMKEYRAVIAESSSLKEEITRQLETISVMQTKAASDQSLMDELKLQVVLLDTMRKEVVRLEEKQELMQAEKVKSKALLDMTREKLKEVERHLNESNRLGRALWTALAEVVFLVEDWCRGPLLAWREADGPGEKVAGPPKPPAAPFEARGVDGIMSRRVELADSENAKASTSSLDKSIQGELERHRPKDVKAWVQFRVHMVAAVEHNNRVESARLEHLQLESVGKQRTAQVLNTEEALRNLECRRALLEAGYNELMETKEELIQTMLKQKEVLLDNRRELQKYAVLKVDHQADLMQHAKVVKRLDDTEKSATSLTNKLQAETGAKVMAEVAAKKAESVRSRAVEEREVAQNKAMLIQETMESEKNHTSNVEAKLRNLIKSQKDRLATNTTIATEVEYGAFTEEKLNQTTFLCPELTIRQLKRLPSVRGMVRETAGCTHPALKGWDNGSHPHKKLLAQLSPPGIRCVDTVLEEIMPKNGTRGKRQKQRPTPVLCSSSTAYLHNADRPLLFSRCNTPSVGGIYAEDIAGSLLNTLAGRITTQICSNVLHDRTPEGPWSPRGTHLERIRAFPYAVDETQNGKVVEGILNRER